MLRKVIDNFDIDAYGWFNTPAEAGSMGATDIHTLTQPSTDVWGLWVNTPTTFAFEDKRSESIFNTADRLLHFLYSLIQLNPKNKNDKALIRSTLEKCIYYQAKNIHIFSPHDLAAATDNHKDVSDRHDQVFLPTFLVSPRTAATVNDNFLLSDAITGYGLEAIETLRQVIPPLQLDGLEFLKTLTECTALPPDPTTGLRDKLSVIASCTLDIWWATQLLQIRKHILSLWPGWSDIFVAQDTVSMPEVETMQSHISKRSTHRSELRRFCMALAWNLNPNNKRLSFPKSFGPAYNEAVNLWSTVLSAPNEDGAKLKAIDAFVLRLSSLLSLEEKPPQRHTPLSGSNQQNLTGEPSKFRASRLNRNMGAVDVQPTSVEAETNTNSVVPGLIEIPATHKNPYYSKHSQQCHDKYRKQIADQISASAWFVPNPPPLEHGNLDGTLDEGNLLRYAAFSDPNIFSIRPEAGAGQIVIGLLIDSSGSMNRLFDQAGAFTALQMSCAFVGGLRDGLARNPNVKVDAFAYDSRMVNPGSRYGDIDSIRERFAFMPHLREEFAACILRRLDTEDNLLTTTPGGGTPTSSALFTLDQYLAETYPEAQRIIIILTDGEPSANVEHPTIPEQSFYDHEEEVRKIVGQISTPTFCVGIGVDAATLNRQYNVGHSFAVESPLDAVPIACNLVRGIGQSLNS